jgi:hypothetical protein
LIKHHKGLFIFVLILVLVIGLILYSPRFLLYSSEYKKADAIILLLGPDFKARQKEAYALIKEGMADSLIIPAYHKTYGIYDKGKGQYLLPDLHVFESNNNVLHPPGFYEDTHLEIIEAKKIMSGYGLKSAIFVSSPYHMRRIKLIAAQIFDLSSGGFYFVPTRFEKAPVNYWELSSTDWRKVRREYSKILWFYIYYTWSHDS